jgi:GTPase SAR1 family protein
MPFTVKKNKSQEKMYVVVDLNHAGPKLLNQLHTGIQEKKDKYVLRYQPLDTSYALIYFKNKEQAVNFALIKNKQAIDDHRKNIKNVLLKSVKSCAQYREFSSNRSYVDALRNIKDLVNRENQDIKIGELRQPLKNISDVVANPLRRNKLAEIKEKNKIQQSTSPNFKELFYLHLERFLHMDEIENKNLETSIFDNLPGDKNHSRLKTKEEIQLMQKFIQRVIYLDALSEPKLLNLFERSKWKIEIESFCHKWLSVSNPKSTFVNRQKLQLFGWRSEMDWIAKKISNRHDGLSIKNSNESDLSVSNLASPSISPLGREKFKPDYTKNKNSFERKNIGASSSGNQIYKKLDFSSLMSEESTVVESSEKSATSNT